MEQRTNINPAIVQQFLESAVNAKDKGQSQFFTPVALGQRLAACLPKVRTHVVDLNCGNGQFLKSIANDSTRFLFGSDIDPGSTDALDSRPSTLDKKSPFTPHVSHLRVNRLTYDATLLYPLLVDIGFTADLFALNPPWRLYWHRDRLRDLANSDLPAVVAAFNAIEPGSPRPKPSTLDSRPSPALSGTIDSTIATLLMALDRCSVHGEGVLIANNNTLDRLIFRPGAPHAAIAKHIWARVAIPGNPMTNIEDCNWEEGEQFVTGVIYFAANHNTGPRHYQWPDLPDRVYRMGAEIRNTHSAVEPAEFWIATKDRVAELTGGQSKTPWNIWLTVSGTIKTDLSLFDKKSGKTNKGEVERLFKLNGRTPMDMVMQRAHRDELQHAIGRDRKGNPITTKWKVHPNLIIAVDEAIAAYHAARAPLYPLNDIQRLAYLDEEDSAVCKKDLMDDDQNLLFQAGQSYALRSQTVKVTRTKWKPNAITGESEKLELTGQELAIYLSIPTGRMTKATRDQPSEPEVKEYCFMDAALKNDKQTTIGDGRQQKTSSEPEEYPIPAAGRGLGFFTQSPTRHPSPVTRHSEKKSPIDFTSQQLAEHFIIPEVYDVATCQPAKYAAHLDTLADLERVTTELTTV